MAGALLRPAAACNGVGKAAATYNAAPAAVIETSLRIIFSAIWKPRRADDAGLDRGGSKKCGARLLGAGACEVGNASHRVAAVTMAVQSPFAGTLSHKPDRATKVPLGEPIAARPPGFVLSALSWEELCFYCDWRPFGESNSRDRGEVQAHLGNLITMQWRIAGCCRHIPPHQRMK